MEIIVLGFWTCQLGFPPTLGEPPKAMIRKHAIMLWAKCDEVYIRSGVLRIYQGAKG
jgi:hypothetical protein